MLVLIAKKQVIDLCILGRYIHIKDASKYEYVKKLLKTHRQFNI